MSLSAYLRKQPKAFLALIGFVLLSIAALIDHVTGENLSFLLFYIIPVYYFTWFMSRKAGALISITAAFLWMGQNIEKAISFGKSVSYLNMSMELIFFFFATYLLCVLKDAIGINEELSRTDGLTGAMNRGAFYDLAGREIGRADRYRRPFTVAYMDIDNFKIVNYKSGNASGDRVLRIVADTIKKNIRKIDLVARFGGDEFTILLPETGAEAAQVVLSRIRNVLLNIMEQNSWNLTFTFGTVTFLKSPGTVEDMMKKVSSVMYSAKDSGMNTIEQEIVNS